MVIYVTSANSQVTGNLNAHSFPVESVLMFLLVTIANVLAIGSRIVPIVVRQMSRLLVVPSCCFPVFLFCHTFHTVSRV